MRTWRGSVCFAFAALAAWLSADSAHAQLLVVATSGEPAVAFAELAYAQGDGAPVTWLSLRLQRGPAAIVAALPEGAHAEPGLDAWLAALEATASPNVILPRDATSCFQPVTFAHVAWPRGKGVPATELSVQSSQDALAALGEQGLEFSGELPQAERYLIWSWAAADSDQTTRTLRIEGGAAPLTLLPGAAFPVLVSSVTRGSMALPGELGDDELSVTFVADKRARSDYRERLQDFLASRSEPLLETRARGPLFDWSLYEDTVSLASLMRNYASIAVKELPGLDDGKCAEQLGALRKPDAPSPSACGSALDASLALGAAGSELATLQRFAVSGASGFAPGDATEGGVPSPPVLRARLLDASACSSTEQPPIVVQPPVRGGGSSAPSGNTTVVVEETVVVDDTPPAEVSCGGSPQPEPQDSSYSDDGSRDSCSSDTSSSSEADSSSGCSSDTSSTDTSDDSGCSSDTSSTDTTDNSGCGSNTSSTSSSDDSGCGSDTSSTSGSDSGCSSSSDESYNGDTCTGAAAPGAQPTEKAQAKLTSGSRVHHPRRTRTSLWAMATAAVILPIRRRKRGRSASG